MSKIAQRIAKIIEKAESTNNASEAAMLMDNAHKMMEKHGLDLLSVDKLNDQDPVGHEHNGVEVNSSWKRRIAVSVAKFYGVNSVAVFGNGKKVHLTLVGRLDARETFKVMFPFVLGQINALAAGGVKEGKYPTKGKAERRISNALCSIIYRMVKERLEEHAAHNVPVKGTNALVPVDLIENEVQEAFNGRRLGAMRSSSVKVSEHARNDAATVNLDLQVGPVHKNAKQIGSA